jgi:hypothetical protein
LRRQVYWIWRVAEADQLAAEHLDLEHVLLVLRVHEGAGTVEAVATTAGGSAACSGVGLPMNSRTSLVEAREEVQLVKLRCVRHGSAVGRGASRRGLWERSELAMAR